MEWKVRELFDDRFRELFKKKFGKNLIRLTRILFILVVISYFFHFAIVPTESMYPTMHVNDFLIIKAFDNEYQRGDIVAFKLPENEKETYLKRIIGLPGETVEVKEGYVYINGKPLKEDYIYEKPAYTYPKTVIPSDSYFVLGDNRNNSYDSSQWGVVKKENIRGKAILVLLPLKRFHVVK